MTGLGTTLFAIGVLGLGALAVVSGTGGGFAPFPRSTPLLARALGLALCGLAVALATRRRGAAASGIVLLGLMSLAGVHAPKLFAHPSAAGAWSHMFTTLATSAAALGVAAHAPPFERDSNAHVAGACGFGIALIGFGAIHLLCHRDIAEMIPAWMPGRTTWPYVTGAANICAGLALITRISSRLAAGLAAAMFGSWLVLIHTPDVLVHVHSPSAWEAFWLAITLSGGVLILPSRRSAWSN